ncbi:MAG: hypothetical protein ACXW0Q_07120 [Methylovulum sp.]
MRNIIIIAAVCVSFAGCANLKYPGWEQVKIEPSAFNKPCSLINEEQCTDDEGCDSWYKKRAIIYHANTVVKRTNIHSAQYFQCTAGLPPYLDGPEAAWVVRNIYNPAATKLDLDKTYDECAYQAHIATVDTSRALPSRVYINTNNYYVNSAQLDASRLDEMNESSRELHLTIEEQNLKYECLKVKGFVFSKSADKKDFDDVKRACPGIDNSIKPCFVPSSK